MSLGMEYLSDSYRKWYDGANAEVDKWFLLNSPMLVCSICISYLIFVLKIGPEYMKNRKPLALKNTLILYNGLQIAFSMFLVYKGLLVHTPLFSLFSEKCNVKWLTKENQDRIYDVIWFYLIAKVTELLDTFFFIVRKKMNQVTFLHVYHHSTMIFFTWFILKYYPSGQLIFMALFNSCVHVVMYTYYLIAGMGPQYQKYIWWKKYMTTIQLIQFVSVFIYLVMTVFSTCKFSLETTYFFIGNTLVFLYLFSMFYKKSYGKKKA